MPQPKSLPSIETIKMIIFDFDGVFTDNKVYCDQVGKESVCCDRRDGLAVDFLHKFKKMGKLNADFFILSTEKNPVVEARAQKLNMPCYGGVKNKRKFLNKFMGNTEATPMEGYSGIIYLGNDLNDLPVIHMAGFSVVPSDAHPMVRSIASLVLPEKGGDGFVRSFVERLLGIDKMTIGEINELISNC